MPAAATMATAETRATSGRARLDAINEWMPGLRGARHRPARASADPPIELPPRPIRYRK
jgi:hypothetical protein